MKAQRRALAWRAAGLSLLLLLALLALWHWATLPAAGAAAAMTAEQREYAELLGQSSEGPARNSGFPTPAELGRSALQHLSDPWRDNGPNDKGLGIQLGHSLLRVALGFGAAVLLAVPLGFLVGMSPLALRALDPYIQVLKPISPLAWMPLALYTIRDSSASGVFVIFICSVWPLLINTSFGVASVRREWLDVARTLEVPRGRLALQVILPAAAPTILTGMRISMGIAWLVIVAAEMLVGGTGIGYFVWNEWNNLSLANVMVAILLIGVVGMVLDRLFAALQRKVSYAD
ncbi:nitrate ABC transporter permease [Eleftheria terrae]|uniref:nitrate ABC transporter permease n=1 Tax=Eleftheria terrae TaxID=1597781 RepID=UPI00263AD98D|nr:nitrate ABC transporter permease [Eleftheria terrae]WKB52796.1 nitrate ABC transporter permease [Eleftheria terrae]